MNLKKNYSNLLICLVFLVFLTIACDGVSSVTGIVYDENNKPVVGAEVIFAESGNGKKNEQYRRATRTDKNGKFSTGMTHAPFNIDLKLTVTKKGYKTFESEFTSREAAERQRKGEEYKIVLEKE